jgi:phospholipid/cholesterol/gamma-HCH transport system permease protein
MTFFTEFGRYLLMVRGMFSKPDNYKMYWKELMHQCAEIGIGSLWIVMIISIFMGAVSALAQIVRDTVILEFAPTLVCIVLAGVVGSKIASELGNMRVSEQIDALEIMGINTKTYLILPKILASMIMIPLLVVISMGLGIWGGRLAVVFSTVMSRNEYDRGLLEAFLGYNVFFALVKGYTFAYLISSIPAYFGYYVKGGALEIGRSSTRAVVVSCIAVLFADYVLAALLLDK